MSRARVLGRRPLLLGGLAAPVVGCARPATPANAPEPTASQAPVERGRVSVLEFGAVPDGVFDCSTAIGRAVENTARAGGGTLVFPPGEYLTGPIRFVSHMTLDLQAGSLLKFKQDFDSYLPPVPLRWEGTEVKGFSPLLYAEGAERLAIVGRGTIDGQGAAWWGFFNELQKEYERTGRWRTDSKWQREFLELNQNVQLPDDPARIKLGFLRPPLLQFRHCKNVLIEGVTLQNSPFWTVNPVYCDNVSVQGITIINPESGPNTDGINPESCSNVRISNCHIDVGDDCITIKSGRDAEGRRLNRPAESYTITNCTMLRGHGGVVIGSEMSGGVRKIVIANCTFDGTDRGIRLKSTRGRGGSVEEMRVSNVVMKNIRQQALVLNMFYTDAPPEPVSERTPSFRNIHVSGVTGDAEQAGLLLGLPEAPLNDVSLTDINLSAKRGLLIQDAKDIALRAVRVSAAEGPAIRAERVENLELESVGSLTPDPKAATVELVNVQYAYIHDCFVARSTPLFLSVSGQASKGVVVADNYLSRVEEAVRLGADLPEQSVTHQR